MQKTYEGTPARTKRGGFVVEVHDADGRTRPLTPRLDLWNHSPDGFAWGYEGSGPAQLALAVAADVLQDDTRAVRLHQAFKRAWASRLPQTGYWFLTESVARDLLERLERERATREEPQPPAVPPGASSPL